MKLQRWLTKIWKHKNLIFAIGWIIFAITDAFTGNTITAIAEVVVSALFFYMYQMDRKGWN